MFKPDLENDCTHLIQKLKEGKISAEENIESHYLKVKDLNLLLNAAVEIKKFSSQNNNGILHGIPVSIKEPFSIRNEPVTVGSKKYFSIPQKDSFIVEKLNKSGASILARGNLSEMMMSVETNNLIFGRTNNPLDLRRTSGGSSGGDAALVASNAVAIGIGSDLGGSIRIPAHFCGIVGFKYASSNQLKEGLHPNITDQLNTLMGVGSLTRSVRDARLVFNILNDTNFNRNSNTKKIPIFSPKSFYMSKLEDPVKKIQEETNQYFIQNGYDLQKINLSNSFSLFLKWFTILSNSANDTKSLLLPTPQIASFSREIINHVSKRPILSKELLMTLFPMFYMRRSDRFIERTIMDLEKVKQEFYQKISNGILMLPTVPIVSPFHNQLQKRIFYGQIGLLTPTIFCNALNLPSITIPGWKFTTHLHPFPGSIMLASAPGNEHTLLDLAENLENHICFDRKTAKVKSIIS